MNPCPLVLETTVLPLNYSPFYKKNIMIKAFIEIKNRIILSIITLLSVFSTAYYYKAFLLILIIISNSTLSNDILNYFIFTSITELFLIYILLGFFVTSQAFYFISVYHSICFLSSGLYQTEYKYLKFIFSISVSLGILSIYFFNKVLVPILSNFFLSFQEYSLQSISFYFEAKIYDYLNFYKDVYLSCFFSFQCCVILILLSSYVSNNIELLKILRKFFYLLLLVFSTLVTPPDIFSQMFLFLNLTTGFEILVLANIFKKVLGNLIR